MSTGTVDPEMKRRFDAAEKIRVGDTPLRRPALTPDEDHLRAHFAGPVGQAATELSNPHVEPKVTPADRARAVAASILIAIVARDPGPTVLVTQRHHGISFPGHWVFPGGREDVCDQTPIETALREAEEEIGLDPKRVEVLGRLGDYYSHSGFRITPAVALVRPPIELAPHPGEVEAVAEIALSRLLDSNSYFLFRFQDRRDRAHFALDVPDEDILLTGVSASICIGLYGELLKSHDDPSSSRSRD